MAMVPEKMDENRISFLANEIARTYMTGKFGNSQEFIETYLDVYEAAKRIIHDKEQAKLKSNQGVSIADLMGEDLAPDYDEKQENLSKLFK